MGLVSKVFQLGKKKSVPFNKSALGKMIAKGKKRREARRVARKNGDIGSAKPVKKWNAPKRKKPNGTVGGKKASTKKKRKREGEFGEGDESENRVTKYNNKRKRSSSDAGHGDCCCSPSSKRQKTQGYKHYTCARWYATYGHPKPQRRCVKYDDEGVGPDFRDPAGPVPTVKDPAKRKTTSTQIEVYEPQGKRQRLD